MDGDVVLFNRQPSLHKLSIMAHQVGPLIDYDSVAFHYKFMFVGHWNVRVDVIIFRRDVLIEN